MLSSRLSRAVSSSLSSKSCFSNSEKLIAPFLRTQIPRTAYVARAPAFRVPGSSFRRWNSTEGEKVKGHVIGIDLGK